MDVTPEQALRRSMRSWRLFVLSRQPSFGSKNLLQLARDEQGKTVLLKVAPNPFDLGVAREHQAVCSLSPFFSRLPTVRRFDPIRRVLAVDWIAGAPTLHHLLCADRRLSSKLLVALGQAVGELHRRSAERAELFGWATAPEESLLDCFIWTRPAFATRLTVAGMRLIGSVQGDSAARDGLVELAAPPATACLIHGDLKLPNLLASRSGPVLIDWELTQWGDPAQDLGSLAADLLRRQLAPDSERERLSAAALEAANRAIARGYGAISPSLRRRVRLWTGAHLLFYAHALMLGQTELTHAADLLVRRARKLLAGRSR